MVRREDLHRLGKAVTGALLPGLMICGFVMPFSESVASDDEYVKALNQEAGKVGTTADAAVQPGNVGGGREREVFERELKEKYAGSAVFYRKLPAATREEIFQEYQAGVSIPVLRKKIMDRFLQR